jgi:SPP1 family predicted phage head-tail adaptor
MATSATGQLNERITFNVKKSTKVNGVAKLDLVPVATVWATVWLQSVKDRIANIGNATADMITFVIRDKQDFNVTNDMVITFNGLNYEIKNSQRDIHQKWMTIICQENQL